jgi:RNA polymerase sigma-70 factor, ECF subfamily
VVVAEVHGIHDALAEVDRLQLDEYYLFHAVRADLLRQLGRNVEAKQAYDAAIERCDNVAEQSFLRRRRQALEEP